MRKINILLLFLLSISVCFGQLTPSTSQNYYSSSTRPLAEINGLPLIRGSWYYVDPYSGDSTRDGLSMTTALKHIDSAYARCGDGTGDGIVLFSRDGSTTSYTTSYLRKTLRWSKNGITVIGINAGNGYFARSRISSKEISTSSVAVTMTAHTIVRTSGSFITTGWQVGMTGYCTSAGTASANNAATFTLTKVEALTLTFSETFTAQTAGECGTVVLTSYCSPVIAITGSNNAFYNLHIVNGGSLVCDTGGVSIQANRNYFKNCHIIGASTTASGALATSQFDVEVDASECTFDDCYFGTNSTLYGAANGHIKLGISTTAIGQDFFNRCHVISNSATSGHAAVWVTNAATLNGWIQFSDCTFVNWQSGALTTLTVAVAGATANNTGILLHNCGMVGWQNWAGTDDKVFTTNAVGASGTGGRGDSR
jgi:hypothetical protein